MSRLRDAGVVLPADLLKLDRLANTAGTLDIGRCSHGSEPLGVGVDGLRVFLPGR